MRVENRPGADSDQASGALEELNDAQSGSLSIGDQSDSGAASNPSDKAMIRDEELPARNGNTFVGAILDSGIPLDLMHALGRDMLRIGHGSSRNGRQSQDD